MTFIRSAVSPSLFPPYVKQITTDPSHNTHKTYLENLLQNIELGFRSDSGIEFVTDAGSCPSKILLSWYEIKQ